MPIAAVPAYLQTDLEFYLSAPPATASSLYFRMGRERREQRGRLAQIKDKVRKFKRSKGQLEFAGWTDIENDQFACTIAACQTPAYLEETPRARKPKADPGLKPWKPLMQALAARQAHIAQSTPHVLTLDALATAPSPPAWATSTRWKTACLPQPLRPALPAGQWRQRGSAPGRARAGQRRMG